MDWKNYYLFKLKMWSSWYNDYYCTLRATLASSNPFKVMSDFISLRNQEVISDSISYEMTEGGVHTMLHIEINCHRINLFEWSIFSLSIYDCTRSGLTPNICIHNKWIDCHVGVPPTTRQYFSEPLGTSPLHHSTITLIDYFLHDLTSFSTREQTQLSAIRPAWDHG